MSISEAAAQIEWNECWLDRRPVPPELAAEVRHLLGIVPDWIGRVADVPWLPRAFAALNHPLFAHMPPHLWRLIAFVVSQDQSCRHCYGLTRSMLKMLGFEDQWIEALERDVQLANLAEPDRLALDFARRVSKANPRPRSTDRARLAAAGFTDAAVAEIAYAASAAVVSNRIATLLALPSERMVLWADRPITRLLRPVTSRIFRVRPAKAEPLPQPNDGPCAEVVAALAGAPAARVLRRMIDEAMASPVLPRRTKLLMTGVIGRALDCAHAEQEVRAGLLADGFDAGEVADVLGNLASPRLDARETLLVPYARETVRYRNTDIQERTRLLAERMSRAEVLEAVGVASLANGVCRLSVLLDAC